MYWILWSVVGAQVSCSSSPHEVNAEGRTKAIANGIDRLRWLQGGVVYGESFSITERRSQPVVRPRPVVEGQDCFGCYAQSSPNLTEH